MEATNRQEEIQVSLRLLESIVLTYNNVANLKIRKYSAPREYKWESLAKTLGIKLSLITLRTQHRNSLNFFARWHLQLPLRLGYVATCHFIRRYSWPIIPKLRLSPQNIIPSNSEIIKACESSDIASIKRLLSAKAAHPNDKTPDNLTVFWVSLLFDYC